MSRFLIAMFVGATIAAAASTSAGEPDGANLVTALQQALHDSATLFARASRDDDGKLLNS